MSLGVTELEARLREAEQAAEEAHLAKDRFLANISHEMRTPMNSVIGMTELALGTELTAEQRTYLEAARASAIAMLEVVNGVLGFAEMNAGDLDVQDTEFSLRQTFVEALESLSTSGDSVVRLVYEVCEDVPDRLRGDPRRLQQVLGHLVSNALKFTREGEVRVTATECGREGGWAQLRFEITDTGMGIPADKLGLIFDAFAQADLSATRCFGGMGLGLTVAGGIVDALGGRVEVESEVGRGSTFSFTIPVRVVGEPIPVRCLRVLVAEDNRINQMLTVRLLEQLGHTVDLVENGLEAIDRWQESDVDLVLMDLQMPRMGGLEATARIRELEAPAGRHTPIVAVTADAVVWDRTQLLSSGMDGFLSKPINRARLSEVVGRVADSLPRRRASTP